MSFKLGDFEIIKEYYRRWTLSTINDRLRKKLRKIADEIADEIINSYDFKQEIITRAGKKQNKIIITSILTEKKGGE